MHTPQLSEQQNNFLQTIRDNAVRINKYVEDMRDEARIKANQFFSSLGYVNLDKLFERIIFQPNSEYLKPPTNIEVNLQPNLPGIVADEGQLIQVLTSIVSNIYRSPKIIIDVIRESEIIHFQITDFARNTYNFNSNLPDKFSFNDLRIQTIVEHIIKAHGGEMWLEQDDDSSTFHFTILIAQGDSSDDE